MLAQSCRSRARSRALLRLAWQASITQMLQAIWQANVAKMGAKAAMLLLMLAQASCHRPSLQTEAADYQQQALLRLELPSGQQEVHRQVLLICSAADCCLQWQAAAAHRATSTQTDAKMSSGGASSYRLLIQRPTSASSLAGDFSSPERRSAGLCAAQLQQPLRRRARAQRERHWQLRAGGAGA